MMKIDNLILVQTCFLLTWITTIRRTFPFINSLDSDIRPSITRFRLNMPSFGNSWTKKQKNKIKLNNRNKKRRIILYCCAKCSKEHLPRLWIENLSRLPTALEFCYYNFVCPLFLAKIDKANNKGNTTGLK